MLTYAKKKIHDGTFKQWKWTMLAVWKNIKPVILRNALSVRKVLQYALCWEEIQAFQYDYFEQSFVFKLWHNFKWNNKD